MIRANPGLHGRFDLMGFSRRNASRQSDANRQQQVCGWKICLSLGNVSLCFLVESLISDLDFLLILF